ncbi:acyltransferase [Algibacter amylolyticus]|uniref:Acyltransferase n=1 Tax=Algibacter amylolyticus TaxID=1608400 RepID=A0A5M7B1I1_9FLAO|nr:acyltransferase [Algibacter amylolyticus]KAA5823503.1 acyltransferase [Algibacter amylolyticus]MBB5267654.1 peptidoglycan/LPS O-acetylase OafA/YrhL [Algibacter amylolyticus]TSJ73991.1 acyltransferase [Algibacter amylolyticus]
MYINLKNRIFGLDVLRAIAILLVLFSHSTLLLFPNQQHIIITVIQFFGTVGVDLFFVLSGFLIGTILLKQLQKGETKFKDFGYFWVRRWFRTLPNYFLILLINIALLWALKGEVINGIAGYFGFIQNFNSPHPDFFTEAWSLSIEEYAYIIGPLIMFGLVYCFKKTSYNTLFLITIFSVIFGVTCFRFNFHVNNSIESMHDWSQHIRKVVIYRIDSIYYGFLVAFLIYNFNMLIVKYKNLLFGLGLVLFLGIHVLIFSFGVQPENATLFFNIFYLPLLSISLLLLFPFFLEWKPKRFFNSQITSISIWSYGLYLVNYSIVLLTIQHFVDINSQSSIVKLIILVAYWLISFLLAYLLYKFFENPITNLRDSRYIKRFIYD